MKRIIACLMVIVLCLGFVGCEKSEYDPKEVDEIIEEISKRNIKVDELQEKFEKAKNNYYKTFDDKYIDEMNNYLDEIKALLEMD